MSLNVNSNKYCCSCCGAGGYSIGLYAKLKGIDNKRAYKELVERECYSQNREQVEINIINLLADIETRDKIYREFLNMLKLDTVHKEYLRNLGFLESSIDSGLYRSVPKKYIKRRIVGSELARKFNLCGIPGFYQEEDFKWNFSKYNGFFVPVFDDNNYIQGLSIHLDKTFNNSQDIWFSSNNKMNGTSAKNWIMKSNVKPSSKSIILADNLLLGALAKNITEGPIIAFQNITNSYIILKEIENTNIKNITFILRIPQCNNNLDYIINRVFQDLLPLGYNLDIKTILDYKDFFNYDFNMAV